MNLHQNHKILTPSGYQSFKGIQKVIKQEYLKIILENDVEFNCSLEHPFVIDGTIVLAMYLLPQDYLNSKTGNIYIKSIETINEPIELYDILEVDNGNIFYANDIITHNCDCDFLTSGRTVIDQTHLKYMEETHVKEPIEMRRSIYDGGLWIWEYPNFSTQYIVSADVARGDGDDFSACHVIDAVNLKQVAEYKGKMPTQEFGNFLVNLAEEYNKAILVIENANVGWSTIQEAINRQYTNLYYSYKDAQYVDPQLYISRGHDTLDKSKMTPGFITSSKTRPLMISKLEMYFREQQVIIQSKRTMEELWVFVWENGKAQARNGYHDDLVMSLAIGLWVRDTSVMLNKRGMEMHRSSFNYMGTSNNLNHRNDAMPIAIAGRNKNVNQWKIGKGEMGDISEWF